MPSSARFGSTCSIAGGAGRNMYRPSPVAAYWTHLKQHLSLFLFVSALPVLQAAVLPLAGNNPARLAAKSAVDGDMLCKHAVFL